MWMVCHRFLLVWLEVSSLSYLCRPPPNSAGFDRDDPRQSTVRFFEFRTASATPTPRKRVATMRAGRIRGFGRSSGAGRSDSWIQNLPRRMRTLAYKSIDMPVGPLDLKETRRTMESVRNDCGLFGGKPTPKKMVGFAVDVITLSVVAAAFAYVLLNPPIYELGEVCPLCDGKGREPCPVCRSNPGYDPRYHPLEGKNKPCPICRGTMSVVCMCCKGAGGARKQPEGDV